MVSREEVYFTLTLQWQSFREIREKVNEDRVIKASRPAIASQLSEIVNQGLAESQVTPDPDFADKGLKQYQYKLTYEGYNKREKKLSQGLDSEGLLSPI
jgi:hypothetical protein